MTLSAQSPLSPLGHPPAAEAAIADDTAREQVLYSLTPFFLDGAGGNPASARAAAQYMLNGYSTETTEELQIAAQIIACGFAALDSLRRAMVDKDLPINTQLRLRGSANMMNRAVQQARKALELRRKARATPPAVDAPLDQPITPADFQATVLRAKDAIAFARSNFDSTEKPRTYWQERRAADREARLSQRRGANEAAQVASETAAIA